MRNFDPNLPLFLQVKEDIENMILSGAVQEDEKIPSVREMAREYELNPNTVSSAISALMSEEIIYKKRGIGMFVSKGSRARLQVDRLREFEEEEIAQFVSHARMLGIGLNKLVTLLEQNYREES